jgi:hypothetical protein
LAADFVIEFFFAIGFSWLVINASTPRIIREAGMHSGLAVDTDSRNEVWWTNNRISCCFQLLQDAEESAHSRSGPRRHRTLSACEASRYVLDP